MTAEEPNTEERRVDQQSRSRVTALERHYRLLTRKLVMGQIWLGVAIIGMGVGFYIVFDQLQDNRVELAESQCLLRNHTANGVRSGQQARSEARLASPFFKQLPSAMQEYIKADQDLTLSYFEAAFPITKDCHAYAEQEVDVGDQPDREEP